MEYLGYLIAKAHRTLRRELTFRLKPFDVTVQQFTVFRRIAEHPGIIAADLTKQTLSDSSTLMGLLDRMEKKGLIRREGDSKDRRINRLRMTKKAESIYPKIKTVVDHFHGEMVAALTEEERKITERTLEKLFDNAISIKGGRKK